MPSIRRKSKTSTLGRVARLVEVASLLRLASSVISHRKSGSKHRGRKLLLLAGGGAIVAGAAIAAKKATSGSGGELPPAFSQDPQPATPSPVAASASPPPAPAPSAPSPEQASEPEPSGVVTIADPDTAQVASSGRLDGGGDDEKASA